MNALSMNNYNYKKTIIEKVLKPHFDKYKNKKLTTLIFEMAQLWVDNFPDDFSKNLDIDTICFPVYEQGVPVFDRFIRDLEMVMQQYNKNIRTASRTPMRTFDADGVINNNRDDLDFQVSKFFNLNWQKEQTAKRNAEEKAKKDKEEAEAKAKKANTEHAAETKKISEEAKDETNTNACEILQDIVPAVEEETDVKVDDKAVEAAMTPKAEESVLKFINSLQGSFAELLNSLDEKDRQELQEVLDKAGLNEDLVKKIKEMIDLSHEEKIEGSTEAAMLPNFSGLVANSIPQPAIIQPAMGTSYTPQQASLTPEQRAIIMQQQQAMNEQVPQLAPNPIMKTPVTPEIHRVDNPKGQPKKVNTGIEDPNVIVKLGKINMKGLKAEKEKQEVPEVVNNNLPKGTPVSDVPALDHNSVDNSVMIKKYPKVPLKEIEEIANQNGCNIHFDEIDGRKGIILVDIADEGNNLRPEKGFAIDTGMIIDRRLKVYPVSLMIDPYSPLELYPAYELMFNDKNNHNKTVLDKKLIADIMIAGVGNIQKRSMYSEEYRRLNLKVALITMPLKGLNAEERGSLQKFLLAMDKQGYLDKALKAAPGSRFVFTDKQLDKNELSTFTLVNCDVSNPADSVPVFYGAITAPVNPIVIRVKKGNVEMEGSIPLQQHDDGCTCDECKKHHSVA